MLELGLYSRPLLCTDYGISLLAPPAPRTKVVELGTVFVAVTVTVDVVEVNVMISIAVASADANLPSMRPHLVYEPATVKVMTVSVAAATTVGLVNVPNKFVSQVPQYIGRDHCF